MFFDNLEAYQRHDAASAPSDTLGGYPNRPTLEVISRTSHDYSNDHDYSNGVDNETAYGYSNVDNKNDYGYPADVSNENDSDLRTVVDFRGGAPRFCRVGPCLYWHTVLKQVKRHRDTHFGVRYGWLCPNRTETCSSFGGDFRRRDQVSTHCRKFPVCGKALRDNFVKIECWGVPANDGDLVPYDPEYHIPYRIFDGRVGCG